MGGKVSDYRAVPLCDDHHMFNGTQAQPGSYDLLSRELWVRYNVDIESVIARLNTSFFFA
jgi:hypothetical protein